MSLKLLIEIGNGLLSVSFHGHVLPFVGGEGVNVVYFCVIIRVC